MLPISSEELFNEDGRAEAKRFIDILTKTLAADPRVLALFTMRTDSFPQFQNDSVLATLPKDTFTLDMMLEGSYREIIEGPAALVKPKPLKIDPQLTEALLQDAAGQDTLPLLAFTLRYLYDKYQANNELSLEGYEKLGRLKGVIDTTVRQALADGVAKGELPRDEKDQLALIRKAFIPHLARVNAAGQFIRRIATRAEISPEAQPLIDCLTEARLLIKDRRTVGGEDVEVIEVAHEALLREWKDLNNALLEEREFLIAKGQLEQDVAEWQATPEGQKKGAMLRDNKLARAHDWLIKRPQDLTAEERQFIQASADAEKATANRHRRQWIAAALGLAALAGLIPTAAIYDRMLDEQPWDQLTDPVEGRSYMLRTDAVSVGRSTPEFKSDIPSDSNLVSRFHLALDFRRNGRGDGRDSVEILDVRSRNGTTINAQFLPYGKTRLAEDGDIIVLAGVQPYQFSKIDYSWFPFFRSSRLAAPAVPQGSWALLVDGTATRTVPLTDEHY